MSIRRQPARAAPPPPQAGGGEPTYAVIDPDGSPPAVPVPRCRPDRARTTGQPGTPPVTQSPPPSPSPRTARRPTDGPPPRPPPPTNAAHGAADAPRQASRGSERGGGGGGDGSDTAAASQRTDGGRASGGASVTSASRSSRPPNRSALEMAAAAHLAEHGARAAAALRDDPPQQQLRAVTIPRARGMPLGLLLKIDAAPGYQASGGSVVVVRSVTPGGQASAIMTPHNLLRPGDRIIMINGVDLRAVHHTKVLSMLDARPGGVTFHVDDSLHTPRPQGHEHGTLTTPWRGPLADPSSRRHSQPPRRQSASLGPPGNPFSGSRGAAAAAQPGTSSAPLPPPSYEEALNHTKTAVGAAAPGPRAPRASSSSSVAPPAFASQPGGLFEIVIHRNEVGGVMIPLGMNLALRHQASPLGVQPAATGATLLASVTIADLRSDGAAAQNGAVQPGDFIVTTQGIPVSMLSEAAFFDHLKARVLRLGVSRPAHAP
eukprot:m.213426 g.213426  ORF g.213426 m.213426 type:complete len:488 (-) comp25560_c1_seq1:163-1626(-)